MEKSAHQVEAWDFLRWFAFEAQPETGTTRYGDLLAQVIGAIPCRTIDIEGNSASLSSPFCKPFVDELVNSVPEPNILESAKVNQVLIDEIQATWLGTKTTTEAATDACSRIESIFTKYYPRDN